MIKVIKNGTVIYMDKNKPIYEVIDIVIENNIIKELTHDYSGQYDLIIDAKNKIVMPGLINCHTHLGMSIFRASNDNLSLMDWLNNKIWPIENNLSDKDIYYTTLLSCIEMIKTGTTTSCDMYFGTKESIKAIKDTKVRSVFSRCLIGDLDNDGINKINEFKELYNEFKSNDLITFTVTPHSLYTCSKEYLLECKSIADNLNLPIHIHFCENQDEVNTIKTKFNMNPTQVLKELGYLENKLILAHSTYISDEELELLKDNDISFIHNPISNLNLGCGIANITNYKNNNFNIALGTDGQGSGNNMNLFYHMSMVDLLQKGLNKNPTCFSSYEVLKIATINGAKALGLDNEIGSIEVNKKADIIIIDLNNIEIFPTIDLINQLIHNTSINNIDTTIINGEVIMSNNKLNINVDEEELKKRINNMLDKSAI